MEWPKVKNPFKTGSVMSPQQLEEREEEIKNAAVEAYKKTITPEFIEVEMPRLFHGMRMRWLHEFNEPELSYSEPPSRWATLLPWLNFGTAVITLLLLFTKK